MTWKASSPSSAAAPPPPTPRNASACCGSSSRTSSSARRRSPSGTASRPADPAAPPASTDQPPVAQRDIKAEIIYCVGGVISPLLANIYLHVLDRELAARGVGELVRYADDGVVLCRSAAQAEHALAAVGEILGSLGLRLHPDKTTVVDLRKGREGLDCLGCHFRARMSG